MKPQSRRSAMIHLAATGGLLALSSAASPAAAAPPAAGPASGPRKPPAKPSLPLPSAEFPYASKFVEVLGSKMHYIDEGVGDPILFLHGNPTSSYLWRNVIPFLKDRGRAIAVDNIGFGKSAKPDIGYTFAEHLRYIEGFIAGLGLKNITLVVHDWGSALGFDYASRHEANIKAIAFMEAIAPPVFPMESYEKMGPEIGQLFRDMRDPVKGPEMIIEQNMFIEGILPNAGVVRPLGEAEMNAYRAPFLDPATRKPILVWPRQIPIGGEPADVVEAVIAYGAWLKTTEVPKLHVYAWPGALNPPSVSDLFVRDMKNIETAYVGLGTHFIQEDNPEAIGRAIADWHRRISGPAAASRTAEGERK